MNYEVQTSGDPKPFAIIGLVIGIISFFFSFIPCIGYYAIGPAILAFMFSAISFFILKARHEKNGISLAGMIMSALAISVGTYQYVTYKEIFETKDKITRDVENVERQVTKQLLDTLIIESQRAEDSIAPVQDTIAE